MGRFVLGDIEMGPTGASGNKILECLLCYCCSLLRLRANIKLCAAGKTSPDKTFYRADPKTTSEQTWLKARPLGFVPKHRAASAGQNEVQTSYLGSSLTYERDTIWPQPSQRLGLFTQPTAN